MEKFRVRKQSAGEFGSKSCAYVIEKKTLFGFYWATNIYFLKEDNAVAYCERLNAE